MVMLKTAALLVVVLLVLGYVVISNISAAAYWLNYILDPAKGLSLGMVLVISLILGVLHGATPDEHTWPITFSYAVGSYSTKGGVKAGLAFSSGFTVQRAILTTLGFLGLAAIYKEYNLDGPVYVIVGIAMTMAGAYILNKGKYIHLPLDRLLHGKKHHTETAERVPLHEAELKKVPLRMAVAHGLIAGWGFGPYAAIITFILAPRLPGLIYAPLPGLFFGIGTTIMQMIFGAIFAGLARIKNISENQVARIGRKTAGRTLYYGGFMFAIIGILIIAFPALDAMAINTGLVIPNLDSFGMATILVLVVVGVFGIGNLAYGIMQVMKQERSAA